MMQSDRVTSSSGVPPYLRAYSTRRDYNSIGSEHEHPQQQQQQQQQQGGHGSRQGRGRDMPGWRVVGAVAVLVTFAAAVSNTNSRWTAASSATGSDAAVVGGRPLQRDGHSYRDEFEAVEERLSGGKAETVRRSAGDLTLVATNEYGEYDRKALALYGLEMVVEPFRETRITVSDLPGASSMRFGWLLVRADQSGRPLDSAEPVVDSEGGPYATVTLTEPGTKYALLVRQVRSDGSAGAAESRTTITCKYVRRELRELTEADRTGFFSAMREFYTVTREEGREKYGEAFTNSHHVTAYHSAENYCYHHGMFFLNAHAAFGLWVEKSLQMIDPKVSLPQWDFLQDAARYGTNWGASDIFSSEMFGSAYGSQDNQFQISDGWFANVTSIYDPENNFVTPEEHVSPTHNAFGIIDDDFNYQAVPGVIRTYSYCGLEGEAAFTECDVFIDCFDNDNLHDWATCMEDNVHADMHAIIGGGFDCSVDMNAFFEENPQFTRGLLTFALEFILTLEWPDNSMMSDYNVCDTNCDIDQTEPCGCTCTTDPFEWTDQEVYEFCSKVMTALSNRPSGGSYITYDETATYPYGFMQDGTRLDDDSALLLLRQLMLIGCEPGKLGAMATGASPYDPVFWALHAGFEKANHILQLSPQYRDTFDFSWVDTDCGDGVAGGGFYDRYPFTEIMLGIGDGSELLTNEEIQQLLHPSNPAVPYLYEDFGTWGTCTDWDPCPECSSAVSSRP
ncbi:unnamed protein product [Pylaiella littoralis]